MTIIELFNKKANSEETPTKFIYDGYTYTENRCGMYKDEDGDDLMSNICFDFSDLNAEIEIIEDKPKHIEELEEIFKIDDLDLKGLIAWQKANNGIFKNKIKQLVEAVNYLLDKEEK